VAVVDREFIKPVAMLALAVSVEARLHDVLLTAEVAVGTAIFNPELR
jgi:hypothetical protein